MALAGNKIHNQNSIEAKKKIGWFISEKKEIMETELFGKKPYLISRKKSAHTEKKEHWKNKWKKIN